MLSGDNFQQAGTPSKGFMPPGRFNSFSHSLTWAQESIETYLYTWTVFQDVSKMMSMTTRA